MDEGKAGWWWKEVRVRVSEGEERPLGRRIYSRDNEFNLIFQRFCVYVHIMSN